MPTDHGGQDPPLFDEPLCLPNRSPIPSLLETTTISKEHRGAAGQAEPGSKAGRRRLESGRPDSPRGTAGASASWGSSNTPSPRGAMPPASARFQPPSGGGGSSRPACQAGVKFKAA